MNQHHGMTLIVKNTTRLVSGFIAVFGVYVALTGHLSPGGGFAGGVILASAGILVVLAFGREFSQRLVTETQYHLYDSSAMAAMIILALLGYLAGGFFVNFMNATSPQSVGESVGRLNSGGTIPLFNLAILVKVAGGLAGVFLALAAFRAGGRSQGADAPSVALPGGAGEKED
ncbi:MAG: Na(+)/H(+) antiporter subunit B [Planctomycetes bacterium ADurb.Bin126]|nr:MAG: Na(+)/H(+) antiporter subunit B [Planctomycetes bacterium ADurb.Bin126]HOD83573.1 MnhB domain-containing protein [Phycisphaerae bacterium]HQL74678.1 MnhB domain-containing protein [Phycisphaerae bacterium]